jgi:prepilin-type processing-associated H-X9-DG protein
VHNWLPQGWAYDSYSKAEGLNGGGWWPGIKPYTRMSQLLEPSKAFVFIEEADPRGYNVGTWILGTTPPGWVDYFAVFHDNITTIAFADGHVESHAWVKQTTLRQATDFAHGKAGPLSDGNAKNPDFVWVWDHFKHVDWKPLQ